MTGYWSPGDIGVDPSGYPAGQVPVKNASTGKFEPGTVELGGGSSLLDEVTLTSAAMSLDLLIPTDVYAFGILWSVPAVTAGIRQRLRFNADDASNYQWRLNTVTGSGTLSSFSSSASPHVVMDRAQTDQAGARVLVTATVWQEPGALRAFVNAATSSLVAMKGDVGASWLKGSGEKVTSVRLFTSTETLPVGTHAKAWAL